MDGSARQGLQTIMLANTIAAALAKNLTPTEINVLGNLITLIGTALTTIAAIEQNGNCATGTDTGSSNTSSKQPNSEKNN